MPYACLKKRESHNKITVLEFSSRHRYLHKRIIMGISLKKISPILIATSTLILPGCTNNKIVHGAEVKYENLSGKKRFSILSKGRFWQQIYNNTICENIKVSKISKAYEAEVEIKFTFDDGGIARYKYKVDCIRKITFLDAHNGIKIIDNKSNDATSLICKEASKFKKNTYNSLKLIYPTTPNHTNQAR